MAALEVVEPNWIVSTAERVSNTLVCVEGNSVGEVGRVAPEADFSYPKQCLSNGRSDQVTDFLDCSTEFQANYGGDLQKSSMLEARSLITQYQGREYINSLRTLSRSITQQSTSFCSINCQYYKSLCLIFPLRSCDRLKECRIYCILYAGYCPTETPQTPCALPSLLSFTTAPIIHFYRVTDAVSFGNQMRKVLCLRMHYRLRRNH